MAGSDWAGKDFYADLGVSSSASQEEIKKQYRKLARENHPDKHPGDKQAEERFKKIAEAYDVIGDAKKRAEYDELKAQLAAGGFGGAGGFFRGARPGAGGGAPFDLGDLFGGGGFGDLFGDMMNRGRQPSKGADVNTEITISFREAAAGTTIPLAITGDAPCGRCNGNGTKSGIPARCDRCHGTGMIQNNRGGFGGVTECPDCHGSGRKIIDPCPDCSGSGVVNKTRHITVRIPAGISDGKKVRLSGKGEAAGNGRPPGDLYVTVHVEKDQVFGRSGNDLTVTVPVSFAEAVLGGTVTVPTLTQPVKLKVPAGTQSGKKVRVRGRGIKDGDLLVTFTVAVPTNLSDAAKSSLRTYAQAEADSGFDPRKEFEQ